MNGVNLIGRLTRDPELKYTTSQVAVARFSVAIDRGRDKDGDSRGADFPSIVAFGKTAELCSNYLTKGRQVGLQGHLQTGSYEKQDGTKVYTTDVVADRIFFIGKKDDSHQAPSQPNGSDQQTPAEMYGFYEMDEDEDIPF